MGEHLPYKQRVTGSSPVVPTICGPVVQLVSTPACHAGGRGFEPLPDRHPTEKSVGFSFIFFSGCEPFGARFAFLRDIFCCGEPFEVRAASCVVKALSE